MSIDILRQFVFTIYMLGQRRDKLYFINYFTLLDI